MKDGLETIPWEGRILNEEKPIGDDSVPGSAGAAVGLCIRCRHVEIVRSGRGSAFYLCGRSRVDPRFARYPALPVLVCPGYEPAS